MSNTTNTAATFATAIRTELVPVIAPATSFAQARAWLVATGRAAGLTRKELNTLADETVEVCAEALDWAR